MIEQLRHDNDKANYIYRIAMLVIYGLVLFLYLTPLPTYLSGNHPKSHMTLYLNHHSIIGTEEFDQRRVSLPQQCCVCVFCLICSFCVRRATFHALRV